MTHGRKTGGRDFQPGNTFSKGRPSLPTDIREGRRLNQVEVERVLNKYLHLDADELEAVIQDPKTTVFDLVVAQILSKAAINGDHQRLEFVLQRLVGKVPDRQEDPLRAMKLEDLIALVKERLPLVDVTPMEKLPPKEEPHE